MIPTPGARVAGRYRVERPLAAGGMGVVLVAHDERLDRRVALKLLRPGSEGDADACRRMIREARSAARLHHPGIVQIYDTGPTGDGGQYVAMELVLGRSLRDLAREGRLPRAEVLRVGALVARALAYAHREGLVHRDVKPDNLVLRPDGAPVLLDFGLARAAEGSAETALTAAGAVLGTPGYLPPEQARGLPLDGRADQYALAVTLHELSTGHLPWPGETPIALLAATVADEPASLEGDDPQTRALDAVLRRAMAKAPEDRFGDCDAFAAALEAIAAADPALARTLVSTPAPASPAVATPSAAVPSRPSDRRVASVAAGVVSLVAVGLGAAFALGSRADPEPASPGAALAGPVPADAVVACVPLATDGPASEEGWLAAAAATLACDRLALARGGDLRRTLYPARLLDLPITADGQTPEAPWDDAATVERARTLGAERAEAILAGHVTIRDGEARVELVVRGRGGAPRGQASGRGALHEAVIEATDALFAHGVLERAARLDPEHAHWLGTDDAEAVLRASDVLLSDHRGEELDAVCARLVEPVERAGFFAVALARACGREAPRPIAGDGPAALLVTPVDPRSEAIAAHHAALEAARAEESSRLGRGLLSYAECVMALRLGETDGARDACTAAVVAEPESALFWHALHSASLHTPSFPAMVRAQLAWRPDDPGAWAAAGMFDPAHRIREMRRGFRAASAATIVASDLVFVMLLEGALGDARGVVAELRGGDARREVARESLSLLVTAAEGRAGAAIPRIAALVGALEVFGDILQQDVYLAALIVELAGLTGDPHLVDLLLTRALEDDRVGGAMWALGSLAGLALVASPPTRAWALERLGALRASGRLPPALADGAALFDAAVALEEGDDARALALLRPIATDDPVKALTYSSGAVAARLDALDPALAARFDAPLVTLRHGLVGTVSPAVAREARRAARRGDRDGARALAARVVEGWSSLDVVPPDLAEMRALAARAP